MKRSLVLAGLFVSAPLCAQTPFAYPSPSEIVASAPKGEWISIAASDLLVMDLSPDAVGNPRRVVIQLMPAPFSQGWIGNIRRLAAVKWWDGTAITRVQDNYVVQWGDPDAENKTRAKTLPPNLTRPTASEYYLVKVENHVMPPKPKPKIDAYASGYVFEGGWPIASDITGTWPIHCYGMVGVGRDMPPDTGTGAELYTVIGHAPRHLDRNLGLVGRVIEGMEHLSSLPRGAGPLGFYETPQERTAIRSVRIGTEVQDLPAFEYLDTAGETFARYAGARANRRDPFFILPAGGADICNIPVPVRRAK